METRKLPFIWTLQRNVDGYSLMLKLPAKSPKRRRRHLETASKDILSREKDINVKTSSRAAPEKEPTRVNTPRRKSPSCKQRDRNRRRRWKRKKKSLRPLKCDSDGTAADSVHETVQDILSLATDANSQLVAQAPSNFYSDHETVQDSLSLADANFQLVADIIHTKTGNDPLPLAPDSYCGSEVQVHSESEATESPESDGDPEESELEYYQRFEHRELISDQRDEAENGDYWCAQCFIEVSLLSDLMTCSRCKSIKYCSRSCQVRAWKEGHKLVCKPAKTSPTGLGKS
jgi:hypothetical protein